MKKGAILFLLLVFLCETNAYAAELPEDIQKNTVEFARKDTSVLKMDIYRMLDTKQEIQPVMFFVFGGAFKGGHRDSDFYLKYFYTLARNGITVVSIDYRLGLVDRKVSLFNTSAADYAINIAVEDLFSATQYMIAHAEEWKVQPDCMMISGSSAGAITVLQADYYIKNKMEPAHMLPEGFRYQGVLSFAGAIFSHKGLPKYKFDDPAPTLFLHGDKDKVVSYNKLRLFKRGMFGSKALAKRFRKNNYNYLFLTMQDKGHSVAGSPMHDNLDIILWFIENYVYEAKNWQMQGCFKDLDSAVEKGGSVWGTVN